MFEEIKAYERYLLNFRMVNKPQMPNFDVSAYTDNEYVSTILELEKCFGLIDDFLPTIAYLKGK